MLTVKTPSDKGGAFLPKSFRCPMGAGLMKRGGPVTITAITGLGSTTKIFEIYSLEIPVPDECFPKNVKREKSWIRDECLHIDHLGWAQ